MEKDRWAEYIKDFFRSSLKGLQCNEAQFCWSPIMKDEIWATIRKMKLGKTTGPDSIAVELLEALEDNGADKIITLPNKIYDTCQVPPDISNLYLYHCQRNQWQQSVNCLFSALSYHQNTFKNHHDVIRNSR